MSSHTIVYKDGHLLFTTAMTTFGQTMIFVPLDWWVTSQGLIIWLNQAAPNLKAWLDGKKSGIDGTQAFPKAMLLTLEGELFHIEVTLTNGINGEDDEKFIRTVPMGPGVEWAYCADDGTAEKAQAAMLIAKDRDEIKSLMVAADIREAVRYEWYSVENLLKQVKEIHAVKYPAPGSVKPAKSIPNDAVKRQHGCM